MEQRYRNQLQLEAASFKPASHPPASGSLGWSSPSNIAIIKYWGKKPLQIPMNPSLSMTLSKARSLTRLTYEFDPALPHPTIHFKFEGFEAPEFKNRISSFIKILEPLMPVLSHTTLRIESENSFPHSSGIASSASAMSALATNLVQLEGNILGPSDPAIFRRKASFMARLGSGSASRSLYPHFALWGATPQWSGSSDEYAIPVTDYHNTFHQMHDTILIVESGEKKVSSSAGHALMNHHPFSKARFMQARRNLTTLKKILTEGNWDGFIAIMEEEALSLHAMMMTGRPGYMLMLPGTLAIINRVREFRKESGCRIGFTLDAGANVHLLYADGDAQRVIDFITSELVLFCEDGRFIKDQMGKGATKL